MLWIPSYTALRRRIPLCEVKTRHGDLGPRHFLPDILSLLLRTRCRSCKGGEGKERGKKKPDLTKASVMPNNDGSSVVEEKEGEWRLLCVHIFSPLLKEHTLALSLLLLSGLRCSTQQLILVPARAMMMSSTVMWAFPSDAVVDARGN